MPIYRKCVQVRTLVARAVALVIASALAAAVFARKAPEEILCPSGEKRQAVEVGELIRRYDFLVLARPLAAWASLAPTVAVDAMPFRRALTGVGGWSDLMSGLAEGWNRCVLTRAEYESGVAQIYSRLKGAATGLDTLRQAVAAGEPADVKRLTDGLAGFEADLRQLARLAGREVVLDRIAAEIRAEELQASGDLEGARQALAKAMERSEAELGPDDSEVAILANNLGALLEGKGDFQGAERHFRRALAIDEKVYGPEHPYVAADAVSLGSLLAKKGDVEGAEPLIRRALAIDEQIFGPEHPDVARAANALAMILIVKPDGQAAVALARRALVIGEKVYGPDDLVVARYAFNLSTILMAQGGDLGEVENLARRALAINEKTLGPSHPEVATAASQLAMIRRRQGFPKEAIPLFEQAYRILATTYGPESPQAKEAARQLEVTRGM